MRITLWMSSRRTLQWQKLTSLMELCLVIFNEARSKIDLEWKAEEDDKKENVLTLVYNTFFGIGTLHQPHSLS